MIIGSFIAAPALLLITTVWPAYATYKAVASSSEPATLTRWLQYWIIFAIFSSLEFVFDAIGAWVPLYYEAKIGIAIWLVADKTMGATKLCQKFLDPYADKTAIIDEHIDYVAARAKNFQVEDVRAFVNWASQKDLAAIISSASSAAKKTAVDAAATVAKGVPEQSSDKPQEPDEVAEVVEKDTDEKKVD